MTSKTILICLVSAFMLITSCKPPEPVYQLSDASIKPFHPLVISNEIDSNKVRSAFSGLSFLKLNTKDSIILSNENRIMEIKGKLLFIDKKLSFVYLIDSAGNVKKVSGMGSGKGNYLSTESVSYDKFHDEIQILSNEKQSFLRFDPEGNFKNETKLDFYATDFITVSEGRKVFFVNQDRSKVSGNYDLLWTDNKLNVVGKAYDDSKLPRRSYAYTGGFATGDTPLFFAPYGDSVFVINKDNAVLKYNISFENRTLPYEIKTNEALFLKTRTAFYCLNTPLLVTNDYIQINYLTTETLITSTLNKASGRLISRPQLNGIFPINLIFKAIGVGKGNTFYSLLLMEKAFAYLKKHPDAWTSLQKSFPDLYKILKSSKPNDNPLIVKYTLNF